MGGTRYKLWKDNYNPSSSQTTLHLQVEAVEPDLSCSAVRPLAPDLP